MRTLLSILPLLPMLLRADQSITLAWDPCPEPDVIGYRVYYGTNSRAYTQSTNVGNVTIATVYGLAEGKTWYFAITARNLVMVESDFSNEVTNTIPKLINPPTGVVIKTFLEFAASPTGPWTEWCTNYWRQELPIDDTNTFWRIKGTVEPIMPK